jgi:hypothetical protein
MLRDNDSAAMLATTIHDAGSCWFCLKLQGMMVPSLQGSVKTTLLEIIQC